MKRAQTFEDLSQASEESEKSQKAKKTFLEQVSYKIPKFKIPKRGSSPKKSDTSNDHSPKNVRTFSKSDITTETHSVVSHSKSEHEYSINASDNKSISSKASNLDISQKSDILSKPDNGSGSVNSDAASNAELARHHYNKLKQVSLNERHESKIYNLRGFNNYVKSLTMNDFLRKLGPLGQKGSTILDLGSGKGGDLRKWGLARPAHVVCVDIADVSIQQCRERYLERHENELKFKANFIVADCTRDDLNEKFKDDDIPDIEFDLVSCQFALHYGFESQNQAKRMLKNAVSHLKPGGYFFGTTPNSNYLVKKYRSLSEGSRFGNSVYYVDFQQPNRTSFPLFGSKYVFYLDGAVEELPEFLIHFPLLKAMLQDLGMECVLNESFLDYIYQTDSRTGDRVLKEPSVVFKTRGLNKEGTITPEEWEVVACYMVFGFRKLTDDEIYQKRDSKRRKVSS